MATHIFEFPYNIYSLDALDKPVQTLIGAAIAATEQAYAPYSQFKVGCAIALADAQIITGSNMENAAYPACICAERVAISHLHAIGNTRPITAIAIAYKNVLKPESKHIISPCGECRQVIIEVGKRQPTPIALYFYGADDNIMHIADHKYLMPFGFSSDDL